MGLDMWLRAKSNKREATEQTGVCSGIFGIVPTEDDSHNIELGYWRKANDQLSLILDNLSSYCMSNNEDVCCRDFPVTKEEIETILEEAKEILATHSFDPEEGYDISEDYDGFDTWQSESKWQDTVEFFTAAKELLEEDPDAEVYFCFWF